ncbi:glycosyl transferase [Ralstonia pickettii]|nr:glycosyl transferase [Ralstonia pickettii]
MKLLLVGNTAQSMFNFRHGLIRKFVESGFEVIVVAPKDSYSIKLEELGCKVIDIDISRKGKNPFEDTRLIWTLFRIYKRNKPDFIIHYTIKPNIYGTIAAHLARIRSIAVTTGLGYTFINKNATSLIAKMLYRFAFRYALEVWFLNPDDRAAFLALSLVNEKKAMLLHSEGVDLTYFAPRDVSHPDGNIRFLLIARMLWDKGIGEYVETARALRRKHSNVVFQLLGACDSENPSAISLSQIQEWKNEGVIEYLGTVEDVRPVIEQADWVVLPSYREGVSRTLMEAASMAKPIITTDSPGCRDVVIDKTTGFICPPKNSRALTRCCENALQLSESERLAMGVAGRALMARLFDERKVFDQYFALLAKYGKIVH